VGVTPLCGSPPTNRAGLAALSYRVGTYATFFEAMLADLSTAYVDPSPADGVKATARLFPLRALTTRDRSDPSIALLDAWAVVADILTFYQERIANEGYLQTAVERMSVVELARLVGYEPRPGVAASVWLAFTVVKGFQGTIPAGTRAQSVPGPGQTPQAFETSADFEARYGWNALGVRQARPQLVTHVIDPKAATPVDTGTDASTRLTVYFEGTSTNLKTGDALLFVFGGGPGQQVVRQVGAVNPQPKASRTEVILQTPVLTAAELAAPPSDLLTRYVDEADLFAGSALASDATDALRALSRAASGETTWFGLGPDVQAAASRLRGDAAAAVARGFTRLAAWLGHVTAVLDAIASAIRGRARETVSIPAATEVPTALERLGAAVDRLAAPPSLQPMTPARLPRTIAQAFRPQTDLAPRLLAAFNPRAAANVYPAILATESDPSVQSVSAFRVRAGLFPGSFPGQTTVTAGATTTTAPAIGTAWGMLMTSATALPSAVALDATYDKIQTASWVAIRRPAIPAVAGEGGASGAAAATTFHRVVSAQTVSLSACSSGATSLLGFSAKSTVLELSPQWLSDLQPGDLQTALRNASFLLQTVVYAQAEPMDLADEPLDADVQGQTIELDGIYDGLETGRWVAVTGQRTDVPNVGGVTASEIVMIAGIEQGARAPGSVAFPATTSPFDAIFYVTTPNAAGDRLVVGRPSSTFKDIVASLPGRVLPGQQFSDQVQLAAGTFANAYVPTLAERDNDFPDFAGLLVSPTTGAVYAGGRIDEDGVGAWRISTQPVHTVLTLANDLAYTYDSTTVQIGANIARATQGQTTGEVLGNGDATQAFQSFALHQEPLTFVPASTPAGASATLTVSVNGVAWSARDSLVDAGPTDRVFTTETDDSGTTTVVFGDGVHGARLPTGSGNLQATYRWGIGSDGNVDAAQIRQLATHPLGLQGVINPLPASGGADPDSRDLARSNAALATRALDRLVSVDDYAAFARSYAGIGKALAQRMSDGRETIVEVTVAGAGDAPIDSTSDLYRNLVQALLAYGDPHQPVRVDPRSARLLVAAATIRIEADRLWENVVTAVRAALLAAFGFDARSLAQPVFLSEWVSVVQAVAGVVYVNVTTFDSVPQSASVGQLAALGGSLGLKPSIGASAATLDAGGDVVPAELLFMTPDIPDTLILTQVTAP
jgi:hypothetical protein